MGTVGDKLFGVPSGLNTIGFIVDRTVTDKYGVPLPNGDTWSWHDLADFAKKVTEASGDKVYGAQFEPWTR